MWLRRVQQSLHKKFSPEGTSENTHRREAVQMHVGRLHLEVCPFGWTDQALPQTHGSEAIQVRGLWPQLLQVRPPGAAPQEAHAGVRTAPVQPRVRAGSLEELLTQQGWAPSTVLASRAPPFPRCLKPEQEQEGTNPSPFGLKVTPHHDHARQRALCGHAGLGVQRLGSWRDRHCFPCYVLCHWKDVCSLYIFRAGRHSAISPLKVFYHRLMVREGLLSLEDSSRPPPPPPPPKPLWQKFQFLSQ